MVRFVLKNNFFEFNSRIKQHISDAAIGTTICVSFHGQVWDKFSGNATVATPSMAQIHR